MWFLFNGSIQKHSCHAEKCQPLNPVCCQCTRHFFCRLTNTNFIAYMRNGEKKQINNCLHCFCIARSAIRLPPERGYSEAVRKFSLICMVSIFGVWLHNCTSECDRFVCNSIASVSFAMHKISIRVWCSWNLTNGLPLNHRYSSLLRKFHGMYALRFLMTNTG